MARREIGTHWDGDTRQAMDENFIELYSYYLGAGLNAQEARIKAIEALNIANEAKSQSQSAENKADNIQEQFNQVVIEGDSSVEAAQARINREGKSFGSLKERLDSSDERLVNITYDVTQFGINTESEDNTEAFNNMVESIPGGSRVLFPKGTYKGNFISHKSLDVDLQGSTIIPMSNNQPIFRFVGSEESPKNVIGNPVYDDISFIVEDAAGLEVGDIGYLVDDSLRPSDSLAGKNSEIVKIREIDGATITVYDKIRSNQNTGNVRFIKINPLEKAKIKNAIFDVNDEHDSIVAGFIRCVDTIVENVIVKNSSGVGIEHTLCYGFKVKNVEILEPFQSTSGKGYGVGVSKSRNGLIENIYGFKTRHLVDLDSCYNVRIDEVSEGYALSSPVVLSHNGYGGKINLTNVNATLDVLANYTVLASNQGLEDQNKHCFRDVILENIDTTVVNHESPSLVASIRIVNNYSNIVIRDTNLTVLSNTELIPISAYHIFVRGNQMGDLVIENVKSGNVDYAILIERLNSNYDDAHNTIINNVEAPLLRNAVWLKGIKKVFIDNVKVDSVGGDKRGLFRFEPFDGVDCDEVVIGDSIHISDTTVSSNSIVIISEETTPPTVGFKGKFPKLTSFNTPTVTLSSDISVSSVVFMKSSGYLQLLAPTGQSITLNATTPIEPPLWEGQELNIVINTPYYQGSRGDVIIPAGSDTVYDDGNAITLQRGKMYKLLGRNRKWIVNQ